MFSNWLALSPQQMQSPDLERWEWDLESWMINVMMAVMVLVETFMKINKVGQ